MPDLPDWYQGFQLVGSDITINVNIEASGVTLPISIDAATVTIDVNIAAQVGNITFEFADQSVAVFDAAKWFAHNAAQWSVQGSADATDGGSCYPATRTVPDNATAFICGIGGVVFANADSTVLLQLVIDGVFVVLAGAQRGDSVIFDTPFRATTGLLVKVAISQISGETRTCYGSMWGYDEED